MSEREVFHPLRIKLPRSRLENAVWVFGNDVEHLPDSFLDPAGCALVRLEGSERLGIYCKRSLISVRLIAPEILNAQALDAQGGLPRAVFVERVRAHLDALRSRKTALVAAENEAFRLVHGDADGLAGLVVDDYGPIVVVQSGSAHVDFLMPLWIEALKAWTPRPLFERSSGQVRRSENLPERTRWLREREAGAVAEVQVAFAGLTLGFVPERSQKTGLFLDQRTNLTLLEGLLARRGKGSGNASFLDLCSYAGAWSCVGAKRGFRRFTLVDQDANALALASRNIERNAGLGAGANRKADTDANAEAKLEAAARGVEVESRVGDLFEQLALLKREARRFDVVVADPPAFAKSRQHLPEAKRAYARLAKGAAGLVAEGGILVLCSCSRNLGEGDFVELLAHALGRDWVVLARGDQAPDHTLPLLDAGSRYLKCYYLQRRTGVAP